MTETKDGTTVRFRGKEKKGGQRPIHTMMPSAET